MTHQRLTAKTFDELFPEPESEPAPPPIPPVIWGCKAIGQAIGRSPDYVRDTLSRMPDSPVRRKGREYYARQDELDAFFRAA